MTPQIQNWFKMVVAPHIPPHAAVLEIGSRNINGSIRPLLSCDQYIGMDIEDGPGVTRVMDARHLLDHYQPQSFDTIICLETLNNVADFWRITTAIPQLLRPNGCCAISVPGFGFQQLNPYPADYYRFTTDTLVQHVFAGLHVNDVSILYDHMSNPCIAGVAFADGLPAHNVKTNLIYHIAPFTDSIWRWNIDRLLQYIDVFNNKLVVAVTKGAGLDPINMVREQFAKTSHRVIFLEIENSTTLGECASFYQLLDVIHSHDPNELTFYAHAKGVTHNEYYHNMAAIRIWINNMLQGNLSDIVTVVDVLRKNGCCGVLRRFSTPPHTICRNQWHYSGTYFWFNNFKLFNRAYRINLRSRHGVEAFPGNVFDVHDAHCLAWDNITESLYHLSTWDTLLG